MASMCTYITAVLAAGADEERVRGLADHWRHGWEAIENRHVLKQLRPGERYYMTTGKYCDCGTALGSLSSEWRGRTDEPSLKVPALRRKGWSEAKIARWLEDKRKAAGHRQRKEQWLAGNPAGPEEELWLGFLNAAITQGATRSIGLLLHWYGGAVETERIDIGSRTQVRLAQANEDVLRRMEYDVLYEFVP